MRSYHKGNSKAMNALVRGLVWVRRRNGSWWPGRILALDELPKKCLLSPKSGTPIQLLGREDGSLDWYNLEKSKRVKAFRCGEYDDCIERAKASAVHSSKKGSNSGKYARREDAILHALELERAHCSEENQESSSAMNNTIGTSDYNLAKQTRSMPGHSKEQDNMARKFNMLEENSTQEISHSVISFEQPNNLSITGMQFMQKKRWKTPNDSEDDCTKGAKRMKDLHDLGLGVVSKRRPNMFVQKESSSGLALPDSASLRKSNIVNGLFSGSTLYNSKDSSRSLKRKKSQVAKVYEKFKRKNRPCPLTKVLKSTRITTSSVCDRGAILGQSSLQRVRQNKLRSLKSTESKTTDFSDVITNSDCSGTSSEEASLDACVDTRNAAIDGTHFGSEMNDNELLSMLEFIDNDCSDDFLNIPHVMEENQTRDFSPTLASYSPRRLHSGVAERHPSHCSQVRPTSKFSEGLGETGSTGFSTQDNNVRQRIDKDTSKGYLKGKRNSRFLSLSRSTDPGSFIVKASQSDSYLIDGMQKDGLFVGFGSKVEKNCSQLVKCGSVSEGVRDVPQAKIPEPANLVYMSTVGQGFTSKKVDVQSAEAVNSLCNLFSYSKDDESLFRRDVLVSPTPPRRSFPHRRICFTSSSGYQVAESIKSISDSPLYDVKLNVKASYQGPRVPLVSLTSKLNSKAIVGHPITIEILEDGFFDALLSGTDCCPTISSIDPFQDGGDVILKFQPNTRYGSHSHKKKKGKGFDHLAIRSPLLKKKFSNRRKSGFSPRKIRKLSSFTFDLKGEKEERKLVVEKMGGPAVTCVPVKLVFSRIHEALSTTSKQSLTSSKPRSGYLIW